MGQNAGQIGGLAAMLGGKLLGSFIGGPIGGAIGGLAGGIIGSLLFNRGSKPAVADGQLATSAYGNFIPILYGSGRFAATVIWDTDIETKKHGGIGKGQTTYSYDQSAAFAFVQGPAKLLKVWLDGKLFYDATAAIPTELTKYKFYARIYLGTEDQVQDPLMVQWVATHVVPTLSCPAYRGLAYLVFQQVDLSHFGGRMPNVTASWSTDYQEKILATKMIPWDDDVSTSYGEPGVNGAGICTDWSSGVIYLVSSDGALRAFDMQSGQCIAAKTFDDLWFPGTEPPWLVNPGDGSFYFPVACAAVCQGSFVYIVAKPEAHYGGQPAQILTVNPSTMRIENTVPVPLAPFPQGIFLLVPFQVISLLYDPADLLVVQQWIWGASIINPKTGVSSDTIPLHWGGIDVTTVAVIGKQDTVQGLVEVWFLNSNFLFDSTASLYIYKTIVSGSDPSAAAAETTLQAILYPSDFGCTNIYTGAMQSITGVYDASDNTLIINNGGVGLGDVLAGIGTEASRSIKWRPGTTDATINPTWTVEYITPRAAVWSNAVTSYFTTDTGLVGNGNSGNNYWVTQATSGRMDGAYHSTDPLVQPFYLHGYSSGLNALVVTGTSGTPGIWVVYLQRVAARETPVGAIITDLCLKAGLEAAAIDVTGVTATTVGYSIMQEKSFGEAIQDLCQTYQIDMTESDYKLKFKQRGSAPVATIPQDDLASIDNKDPSHYWEHTRPVEQEMPLQINLKYSDPELDYQPGASYAKRIALPVPTVFSRRLKTIELPVQATNVEARHIAESWLYTMWAERDTYKIMVAQKYLYLDPTDNVTVGFANGDEIVARITTTDIGDDYSLKLDLSSEDETVYAASPSPGALISYVPQTITQTAFIDLLQFNVPLLQDSDDLGGSVMRIYWAGGPTAPLSSSASANLYESVDGSAWPLYATADAFADWGHTVDALGPTVAAFSTDYDNTVTFHLAQGSTSPVSCTYYDMMNGVNAALVGREIIQFQSVSGNADGSYTLRTLLRGRRGTEWAIGTHVQGENIIFLEIGQIQPGRLPLSLRSQTTLWKLVPAGRFIDSTPADSFAYRAFDLMPYAPVNAERTMSGSNVVLTWIRRTRMGGLLIDGTDTAPLNEESEAYEVYFLASADASNFDPTDPATYVRAFTGLTASTLTYTASMMTADGFDPAASTIYAVIYQISAVVGRGFPALHELPSIPGGLTVGLEDGSGNWTGFIWG